MHISADGKGERVREDIAISQGQEIMRANSKSQREGGREGRKQGARASEQGGRYRNKEDERRPVPSFSCMGLRLCRDSPETSK